MKKLLLLLPLMAMFAISSCSDDNNDAPAVEGLKLTPETADILTKISKTLPTLALTVTPAEAANQVVWASDKPDVISVDAAGKLTLVKESTAKITITASAPSGQKATCVINMADFSELTAGGYGFIDAREELGMLLLDRNVGATEAFDKATKKPESIGNYYQWGKNTPVAVGDDAAVNADYDKEWNATGGSFKDWSVAANTPCPAGWAMLNRAQVDLIGDKAWPDYDDMLGDQGLPSQTPAELAAAKALFAKLKIAMSGYWSITGNTVADRTSATPKKTTLSIDGDLDGGFWSGAINTDMKNGVAESPSARGFQFACGISTNEDAYYLSRSKIGKQSEVNSARPVRCVKAVAAPQK